MKLLLPNMQTSKIKQVIIIQYQIVTPLKSKSLKQIKIKYEIVTY